MRYKFFTNSEKTWQAMFQAIQNAKESVYLEMYIFNDDMHQYDFLKLLKEKAKNGLRVRIILDSFGSMYFGSGAIDELKENGAELFFFSYLLHYTHRKILVVDEKRAFIGGVNFSQSHRRWSDLTVEVRGRLVKHIIRSFAKVYSECGGRDAAILSKDKPILLDKTRTWLVEHFPIRKTFGLKKVYKEHIVGAKENIIFVTPYFMPRRWFVKELHRAVLRGVKVEVLIPDNTDVSIVDRVNYFYICKLAQLGVNFYIDPRMNHAKVMIIDNKEGIVGSHNLDFLSFELGNEIGVFLKDAKAVKKLLEIYKKWKKNASLFDFKTHQAKWFDYIVSPVFSIFSEIW